MFAKARTPYGRYQGAVGQVQAQGTSQKLDAEPKAEKFEASPPSHSSIHLRRWPPNRWQICLCDWQRPSLPGCPIVTGDGPASPVVPL